ncbi:alpha/beta fold hydrolase [Actinocorallia sp. B10E7]|uniref:alpha/beta fold hydrolase n=1 Tax=Actinocorallia sp. B10E7 TaxID=3153558 RepID=UPI00325D3661
MTRTEIGRFASEAAKARFLEAYEEAMRLWPSPRSGVEVETSYGTVYVHRHGPESGEPVVLLHGHGANASTWYPQVGELGERHPVFAIDTLDDPGRSVQRAPAVGSRDNARWLDETLAALKVDGVHLVGHSYGGWLALNQAIHAPERLASVTLLDPGGLQKVPFRFLVNLMVGVLAMQAPRRFRPRLARLLANVALVAPPELMKPTMFAARAFKPNSRPPARLFTDEELRSVGLPVLALLAQRSTLLDPVSAGARLRSLVPSVRVEIVPGVGHGLPLEEPRLVNERILRFVESGE